jgi:hypothetical protein
MDNETAPEDPVPHLLARIDHLERQIEAVTTDLDRRFVARDLRAEARRAGLTDMDALSGIDLDGLASASAISDAVAALRREKPGLFAGKSTSGPSAPPPFRAAQRKDAMAMTDEEYRVARAELLRRR